ncbi:hypothetical protein TVAG_288000 [Trichomonas vaginalis G3]|uniref:Uncharacterized protein n=1 Tax=Trichomonas vaginalis (strain ATCC PRA-98 / G3) TaxID=412133 RepID=A2G5W1_TRIV3|nr:hypothetical protein TVAGG3_0780780 [Trichomonas vaginalis G3]EAX87458.1 hypothetical protein TVAG_288000 [Trichomonas vaginalis G3]KAI5495032.1 hypothetical protein TVAGG3_0780780 [Trichomonas vaginalis G3]|eukprot:XP_001300388.1 hypothetical protein [Trichomonas vaginalis G3]
MSGIKTNYTLKPSRYPGLFTAKQNISILIKPHFNQQLELKSRILPNYCKGFGLASTYLDLNTLRSQLKGNQCVWLPYIENVQHSNEKYLYTYSIRSISTFLPQNQSVLMKQFQLLEENMTSWAMIPKDSEYFHKKYLNFSQSTVIDDLNLKEIKQLYIVAPKHNTYVYFSEPLNAQYTHKGKIRSNSVAGQLFALAPGSALCVNTISKENISIRVLVDAINVSNVYVHTGNFQLTTEFIRNNKDNFILWSPSSTISEIYSFSNTTGKFPPLAYFDGKPYLYSTFGDKALVTKSNNTFVFVNLPQNVTNFLFFSISDDTKHISYKITRGFTGGVVEPILSEMQGKSKVIYRKVESFYFERSILVLLLSTDYNMIYISSNKNNSLTFIPWNSKNTKEIVHNKEYFIGNQIGVIKTPSQTVGRVSLMSVSLKKSLNCSSLYYTFSPTVTVPIGVLPNTCLLLHRNGDHVTSAVLPEYLTVYDFNGDVTKESQNNLSSVVVFKGHNENSRIEGEIIDKVQNPCVYYNSSIDSLRQSIELFGKLAKGRENQPGKEKLKDKIKNNKQEEKIEEENEEGKMVKPNQEKT